MPRSTAGLIAATRLGHAAARAPEPHDPAWRPENETSRVAAASDTTRERVPTPPPAAGASARPPLRWMLALLRPRRA